MFKAKYFDAIKQVKIANNILLVTHSRPDGDAVAALCAMAELLKILRIKHTAYSHDRPPQQFNYLANFEDIISDKDRLDFASFDLIIALDCGQLNRTMLSREIAGRSAGQFVLEIDHHPRVREYADLEIRDIGASSTCEIIYDILSHNKIEINKSLATAILTGIMTDTGNFFYSSTTEKTIAIAAKLMKRGARFPLILENTWRNKSISGMKIWGTAMRRLFINQKYGMAITVLTRKDFEDTQATDEEMEGIPGFLSNIADADTLLVLRELDTGQLKGSLRSTNKAKDISKLAQKLGGGGHPLASAFTLDAKLIKKEAGSGWEIV